MAQKFYQPNKRPRKDQQADDSEGIFPSFYHPENDTPGDTQSSIDDINKVLGENDALRDSQKSLDGSDIKSAEETADDGKSVSNSQQSELDQLGKGYSQENEKSGKSKSRMRKVVGSRKRALWGGGILGGTLAGLLLAVFLSLPLKVQNVVNNLQSQFFGSASQATEDMANNLFAHYLVKQVVPGMAKNKCTSTRVNRDCVNTSNSDTIIGTLYNGWRDGKVEKRLADNGIEIIREGNAFYIKTPSTVGELGEKLGDYDSNNPNTFRDSAFKKMGRADIRKQVRSALQQETKWDRVMYRFKVGHLLEKKYGIKRCIIACNPRDRFTDSYEAKKLAFKSYLLERIITPRNEMMGLALECAVASFDCTKTADADENGEKLSKYETDLRARLLDLQKTYGTEKLDELSKKTQELRTKGVFTYMLEKVAGPLIARTAEKTIPVIGWVSLAGGVLEGAKNIGPAITKLTYVSNAATMVQVYSMYRTNADEIKTGDVDAAAVGSVADSLSETDGKERTDQNGVGMEGSPLYGALLGGGSSTTSAFLNSRAYAASKSYGCEDDDGKMPREGQLVCGVERLDNKTAVGTTADYISKVANSPAIVGGDVLVTINNVLETVGSSIVAALHLGDLLGWAVNKVLDIAPDSWKEKVTSLVTAVVSSMMKFVIKPILSDDPSGARMFNLAAGGADVAGNYFAHYGLGGAEISDEEAFAIRSEQEQDAQDDFSSRSLFARIFSTDTKYSLVSKAALAMPSTGTGGVVQDMANAFTSPFNLASASLGSVISGKSSAATGLTKDPFGVTQYGYSKNDKVFTQDPEQTWKEEKCDDPQTIKDWGNKAVDNPDTQMPDHKPGDVNRCMLIKSAAGSAGAMFTDNVLDPEERGETDPTTLPNTPELKVATYNMLAQDRAATHGYGGDERLQGIAELISERGFHIVAAQELLVGMQTTLMGYLPSNYAATQNVGGDSDVVIYDSTMFEQTGFGTYTVPKVGKTRESVWVKLKSKSTGKEIYVFSMHDDLNDPGTTQGAQSALNTMQNLVGSSNTPVIIMGDMNSYYPPIDDGNEAYKTFKASGKLLFTTELTTDRTHYDCDTIQSGDGGVYDGKQDCGRPHGRHADQVWISKNSNIVVNSWENIADSSTISLSDHNPVAVTMTVDGLFPQTSPGPSDDPALTDFNVATYNILHAVSFPRNKCGSNESNEACRKRRSNQQVRIILGQADNHPALDIVGLQEVSQPQYSDLKAGLGSKYGFAPKQVPEHQGVAIMWNAAKFTYVTEGTIKTRNNVGTLADTPWVKLQTASGTPVYVLVTHSPNDHSVFPENGGEAAGPSLRAQTAKASLEWAESKDDGKSLIFTMGDYNRDMNNRGNPDGGAYCIMTTGGTLKNTYDMVNKPGATRACPSKAEGHGIDHVYATPISGLTATDWTDLPEEGIYAQASDHTPVYATLSYTSAQSGGFVWPIKQADYRGITVCWNQRVSGGYHAGIDIDVDNANPPPAYAAKDGVVSKTGSGGAAGNYVVIEHGGGIWTAYEHLTSINVTVGQHVTAGYQIGISGTTGNSSGAHLHFGVVDHDGTGEYSSTPQTDTMNPLKFLPKDGRNLGSCG